MCSGPNFETAMNIREIKSTARQFRDSLLGKRESDMMCAVVCYPLQGYLAFLGVKTEIAEVILQHSNHIYLLLPDGRVLDPTADQFGDYPKVYIGEPLWFHQNYQRRA